MILLLLLLFFSNYSFVINCGGPSSWESPTPYAISTLYFVHVNREQRTRITQGCKRAFEKETRFQSCKVYCLSWKLDSFVAARRPINLEMVLYSFLTCRALVCQNMLIRHLCIEYFGNGKTLFFLVDYAFIPPTFVLDNSRFISAENSENGYQNCIAHVSI